MATRFFTEDTVALKEDPSIWAEVDQTWRNVDVGAPLRTSTWIRHSGISKTIVSQCVRDGRLPTGYVVIHFLEPYTGSTLIKESQLILKDRGLMTGDVVKLRPSDFQNGYVVKVSTQCTLLPVYTDLPYIKSESWPHNPQENKIKVSSEELEFLDYQIGDHVLWQDWIGEVVDVHKEVKVRLANGTVVRVLDSRALEVEELVTVPLDAKKYKGRLHKLLKKAFEDSRQKPTEYMVSDFLFPGQRVRTKKGNLRLGLWIIGSYSPEQAPEGVIVEATVSQIRVDWMSGNLAAQNGVAQREPPTTIDADQLDEVTVFNKYNLTSDSSKCLSPFGSRYGYDMAVGDLVKFRDAAGAAVKYSVDSPNRESTGVFRRIPRTFTQGFDMNVFLVRETSATATVQWQDGSTSDHRSIDLIPDTNIDDHELWVGELCSLKSTETESDGMKTLMDVGVVQSVDSRERIAKVRWFINPQVLLFSDRQSIVVPSGGLGELSEEETTVSLYEVMAYPALTKRRGDQVFILSESNEASNREAPSRRDIRWYGEIVDLGRDGLLTVRLSALKVVEDIKVPADKVVTVYAGEEDGFYPDEDPYDRDEDMDSDEDDFLSSDNDISEAEAIEQVIDYEGGTRLDDGTEDAWMTDESADSSEGSDENEGMPETREAMDVDGLEPSNPEATNQAWAKPAEATDIEKTPRKLPVPDKVSSQQDYDFAASPNVPSQFEILEEEPPLDHHYLSLPPRFPANLLRRIRREHKILSDSLPPGIWVRTWSERLDLLRIMMIGPRGTPYELAPFVFDFRLKDNFPSTPPEVFFHSWTHGIGRINPNLYEDGNVCLSVLGTWPENNKNEGWNSESSSILQVIVSILGLVLVAEPYYNEAGFESLVGTEESKVPSRIYTERAFCMAKGFIAHAISKSVIPMDHILEWIYIEKEGPRLLATAVKETKLRLPNGQNEQNTTEGKVEEDNRVSAGAEILLRKHLTALEARLRELEE